MSERVAERPVPDTGPSVATLPAAPNGFVAGALTPPIVLALQRTAGNGSVCRMIAAHGPRCTCGEPLTPGGGECARCLARQARAEPADAARCEPGDQGRAPSLVSEGREQRARTFGERLSRDERRVWGGLSAACRADFGACSTDEQARVGALPAGGEPPATTSAAKHARLGALTGRIHAAMDVAAPRGALVFAPIAGEVTVSQERGVYGRHIAILHSCPPETPEFGTSAVLTLYAHLDERLIELGPVAAGQSIGRVGDSGVPGRVHLHFSVRRINRRRGAAEASSVAEEDPGLRINPATWLAAIGVPVGPADVREGGDGAGGDGEGEGAGGGGAAVARRVAPGENPLARFPLGEDARPRGSPLPYSEARELHECLEAFGPAGEADCRDLVLGPIPPSRMPLSDEQWRELAALAPAQRRARLTALRTPRGAISGSGGYLEHTPENFQRFSEYFAPLLAPLGLTPDDLLAYSSDLRAVNATYRELPPIDLWPNMRRTLEFLALIGPAAGVTFTILSAYRSDVVNALSGGARGSAHEDFSGLDVRPSDPGPFGAFIKHFYFLRGAAHRLGLGYYSPQRVHIDTRQRRRWEWEDTAAEAAARYADVFGAAPLP